MFHQHSYTYASLFLWSLKVSCMPRIGGGLDASTTPTSIFERQGFQYCPLTPPFYRYATFGDSYASGVTYGSGCVSGNCGGRSNRDYDYGNPAEIRRCRRLVDAYAYLIKNDCSWTNGTSPYLDWPACSGSKFAAITGQAKDLFDAQQSAGPANISNFATLQIGGNDAFFFEIAASCFFQPDNNCDHDFGPAYPDRTGQCWAAIRKAQETIDNNDEFHDALIQAFTDILDHPAIKPKKNFRLFVLSYAQLFKINDPLNGDACDDISWSAYCTKPNESRHDKYKVTTKLRQDINGVLLYLNNRIATAVADFAKSDPRILYVNIDGAFEGHRFCQEPDSGPITTGWESSWFWRAPKLSDFFGSDDGAIAPGTTPTWDANSPLDPATVSSCTTMNDPSTLFAPWDTQLSCQLLESGHSVAAEPIGPDSDWSGPGGGGLRDRGEVLRTFHPTKEGHEKIHDFLVEAIKREQRKSSFLAAT